MNGSIKAVLDAIFAAAGFTTTTKKSRYMIEGELILSPMQSDTADFLFTAFTLHADLVDTATNSILLPLSLEGKEGHTNQIGADTRALRTAERQLKDAYTKSLNKYLQY